MTDDRHHQIRTALEALASMIERSRKAQGKFAMGTSQYSLQVNRIKALQIATCLLERELPGAADAQPYSPQELQKAQAPLASLIHKSEKARQKLAAGTWQHTMLTDNLQALHLAQPLLEKACEIS